MPYPAGMNNSAAGQGLGDRLRLAWQKSGRKQQAVGDDIGRSAKALRDWMSGAIVPDYDMVMAFARATGADPIWLWTGMGSPTFTAPANPAPTTLEDRVTRLEIGLNEAQQSLEQVAAAVRKQAVADVEANLGEVADTARTRPRSGEEKQPHRGR